ncbi:MAG: hypothetical protein ACHQF2_11680, partial [Flavobacteriales bacterium]
MKNTFILLTLLLGQQLNAQINLEGVHPTPNGTYQLMFTQLDSGDYKYVLFLPENEQFILYNLNHSVYMTVNVPIPFNGPDTLYWVAYITRSLFDCDSSNIEYLVSYVGDGFYHTYPKKTYLYRTDGTLLQTIDSAAFMGTSIGWEHGPLQNKPII